MQGYVWRPGQSARTARLVMLNEQRWLAPDRAANQFGVDDRCLYRLCGHFTGDLVYDLNTNRTYPGFLLTGYVLLEGRDFPGLHPGVVNSRCKDAVIHRQAPGSGAP